MKSRFDMISAYKTLNRVAESAGIVLFGSTSAARLPLNELMQDYNVEVTVYNRSVENLTIEQAESYIPTCIAPLMPKTILLHFGESELLENKQTVSEILEAYRWLLYQLHTALPDSRLVLISANNQLPHAEAYNEALHALAKEYGCQYTESPNGSLDAEYELRFFHTLRSFFYDCRMNLADALRYCAV
jgi:hypothetical protein